MRRGGAFRIAHQCGLVCLLLVLLSLPSLLGAQTAAPASELSSVVWSTKGDFENNLSTTGSPVVTTHVDVSGTLPTDDATVTLLGPNPGLGSTFTVHDGGTGVMVPSVVYNSVRGKYVVVYSEASTSYAAYGECGIYAQLVDASGTVEGSRTAVATSGIIDAHPDAAFDAGSDKIMAVWRDTNDTDDLTPQIHGRILNGDGSLDGPEFAVATSSYYKAYPAIAHNPSSHDYMVVWMGDGPGRNGRIRGVYGQRVTADSSTVGSTIEVLGGGTYKDNPAIAANPSSSQFLVAFGHMAADYHIATLVRTVNATGTLGNLVEVASTGLTKPAIARDPLTDRFLVVGDGTARFVDADGSVAGPLIPLGSGSWPDVAYNPDSSQFIVVWSNGANIYSQRINSDGAVPGPSMAVSGGQGGFKWLPSVASSPHDFVTVWGERNGGCYGVFGERHTPEVGTVETGAVLGLKFNAGNGKRVHWSTISWNGSAPGGSSIRPRTRGAYSEAALTNASWSSGYTTSGSDITTPDSQWLEVEVSLASLDGMSVPLLKDIQVDYGPPQPTWTWTWLHVLNSQGGRDQSAQAQLNLLEMEADNPNVDTYVLWDRPGTGDSAVYHVEHDDDTSSLAQYTLGSDKWLLNGQSEVNLGDPQTLVDFAGFVHARSTSPNDILVIDSHSASSPTGVTTDDRSANRLTVKELAHALDSIAQTKKPDVVYFSGGRMQTAEVNYELRDSAPYVVASEFPTESAERPDLYLASVSSGKSPLDLARSIATVYHAQVTGAHAISVFHQGPTGAFTSNLAQKLDELALAANAHMPSLMIDGWPFPEMDVSEAVWESKIFNKYLGSSDYVDVRIFASRMFDICLGDQDVRDAAQAVIGAVNNTEYKVFEAHQSGLSGGANWNLDSAAGLAIYLPDWQPTGGYSNTELDFASDTHWDEFLRFLNDTKRPVGSISINHRASYTNTRQVTLTLSASDCGSGVRLMRFANQGGNWTAFEPFQTTKLWTLSAGDGPKVVWVRYADTRGNVSNDYETVAWNSGARISLYQYWHPYLSSATKRIETGRLLRFTGRVEPTRASANKTAYLQKLVGRRWVRIGSVRLGRRGTFVTYRRETRRGTYKYRLYMPRGAHRAGYSSSRTITWY